MPVMKLGKSPVTGIDSTNDIPDVGTFDASGALEMFPALISIYKNMAERQEGVKAFLEGVANFAHKYQVPNLLEAAQWLVQKYPRVAAHMTMKPDLEPMTYDAAMRIKRGKVKEPIPLSVSSLGLKEMRGEAPEVLDRAKGILIHEGTHTAQALGNSDMANLYWQANRVTGYPANPFELPAYRRQASVGWSPIRPNIGNQTAIQLLEQAAVRGGSDPEAAALRELFRKRYKREPMAVSHVRPIPPLNKP